MQIILIRSRAGQKKVFEPAYPSAPTVLKLGIKKASERRTRQTQTETETVTAAATATEAPQTASAMRGACVLSRISTEIIWPGGHAKPNHARPGRAGPLRKSPPSRILLLLLLAPSWYLPTYAPHVPWHYEGQ